MIVTSVPLPLRAYNAASRLLPVVAKRHLQKRISIDKEDPIRWVERLGRASEARPDGQLIWVHAVGLGEVLSLRGLVQAMATQSDAHFLITSGTKAAARALAQNMPPRTRHQFLPMDAPRYRNAFLDHWKPDLCVWVEQDIWPGFVLELARRNIPQAHIVCRMHESSWRKKSRMAAAYRHIYKQMALLTTFDQPTQEYLRTFGIEDAPMTGPIKPTSPPLTCDPVELAQLRTALGDRFVWIVAPSHPDDEALAQAAHRQLLETRPDALLIIAPRYPKRTFEIALPYAVRSKGELPAPSDQIYLADTFGDLGLLYRVTRAALIGGTFDDIEGHSPWEAANLDTAVMHGPRIQNFAADYAALAAADAARPVNTVADVLAVLNGDLDGQIRKANAVLQNYRDATQGLAQDLIALI